MKLFELEQRRVSELEEGRAHNWNESSRSIEVDAVTNTPRYSVQVFLIQWPSFYSVRINVTNM